MLLIVLPAETNFGTDFLANRGGGFAQRVPLRKCYHRVCSCRGVLFKGDMLSSSVIYGITLRSSPGCGVLVILLPEYKDHFD